MEYTYEFLRKCHGLRFRAKSYGVPVEGIVKVDDAYVLLCYGKESLNFPESFNRRVTRMVDEEMPVIDSDFTNFEIVPRDPETYKDWQVGDKVCENEHRNALYEVIFRSGELVFFKDWNNYATNPFTCSEAFRRIGLRLVLTDIEKQIIEERKKAVWEPQDGDICYAISKDSYSDVFIYKPGWKRTTYYASSHYPCEEGTVMMDMDIDTLRPATNNEKLRLFAELEKNGKRWNAEKKVIEDIEQPECDEPVSDEPTFKKFDAVLVRCGIYDTWKPAVFKRYGDANECPYITVEGYGFQDCVPLNEDTEKLICTTNLDSEEK